MHRPHLLQPCQEWGARTDTTPGSGALAQHPQFFSFRIPHIIPFSEPELRSRLRELVTASPGARRGLLASQIKALAKQVNDLTPFRGDLL